MLHNNLVVIDLKSFLYYSKAIRLSRTSQGPHGAVYQASPGSAEARKILKK